MSHKQLTLNKRYPIWALLQKRWKPKKIAKELGVHPSTISREIKRNWDEYRQRCEFTTAHLQTQYRHKTKPKYSVITVSTERYILEKLKAGWSPEQISSRMKYEGVGSISYETIYQLIYRNKANKGRLYKYLRHKNKRYHKRGSDYQRRGIIIDRVMIDRHPKIVDKKKRIGDFEIVTSALIEMLEPIKPMIKTITYDNGKESLLIIKKSPKYLI